MANGSDGSIVIDTDLDTKGFEKNSARLQGRIANLVKQIDRIGDIPFDSTRFSAQVDKAKDSIDQLKEEMDGLAGKTISTVDYEDLTKSIEQAEKALFRMYDRRDLMSDMGVKESSAQWQRLQIQIQNAEADLERFNAQKAAMEASGTAFVDGSETAQFQELNHALLEAERRLQEYEAAAQNLSRVQKAEGILAGMKNALLNVAQAAGTAVSSLAKLTFGAVASGVKKAVASFKSFVSESMKVKASSKGLLKSLTSLKTMLVSRLKRMFISQIFNEMKEAMNKLAQFDSTFNTAMSNMKNSAKELSANMAVTFASLIKTIEPFVTQIVAALSTAIRYLNAFFAMLQGKSTMTVAKKQTASYADSLKDAGKNAKELNRQLMGFDELNRLEDSEDSSGGGGSGPGDLFEEVPVDSQLPESVKDFFTRLRDAFKAGDWEEFGAIIAGGLNTGMKYVDNWITGTLQPLAYTWSARIARVLNGLVSGLNWHLMGKTLADGFNTVFGSINIFLKTFDFDALGRGFGDAINGIIEFVGWENVGDTLITGWNSVVYLLDGAITAIDWAAMGQAFSEGVQSIVTGIDLPAMASTLSDGITGALTGIYTALETFEWATVADNFYQQFTKAIQSIDWSGMTTALFRGIGAALGGLSAFIWRIIQRAWADVAKWWKETVYKDGQFTIGGLLSGIVDALSDLGNWIKTNIFDPFIQGFKNAFGISSSSKSSVMKDQGSSLVQSMWDGLLEKVRSISWSSIGENIIQGIKDGINAGWTSLKNSIENLARSMPEWAQRMLGIHSPSRVFRDKVGLMAGLGLAEGIEDSERTVAKTVSNLAQSTVDAFGNPTLSTDIVDTQIVNDLDTVANHFSRIVDAFSAICEMLSYIGELQVPQIATGSFVPPRIKAASASADPVEPEFSDGNDLTAAFADFSEKLDDIIFALGRQQFVADFGNGVRILAREVSREQRRNLISEGG